MDTLIAGLQSAFWFVVVLGVLVFFHEFGHFAVAKAFRMRVDAFSLGFGPRLAGFVRGGTDYRLSAIPLGGYVKLAGEIVPEEDESIPDPEQFLYRPRWQRFLVLVMGATVNILMAVVFYWVVYVNGLPQTSEGLLAPVVGMVAEDSGAEKAGVLPGDRILSMDGEPIETWRGVQEAAFNAGNNAMMLELERAGEKLELQVVPKVHEKTQVPQLGINPAVAAVLENLEKGYPAMEAGLQAGDKIMEIDGERVWTALRAIDLIHASPGRELVMVVERGTEQLSFRMTPLAEKDRSGSMIGRLGFQIPMPVEIVKHSVGDALVASLKRCREEAGAVFQVLKMLVMRDLSPRTLSGPIEIAGWASRMAERGWVWLFQFMGFISLQLGILNLLPIPVLDGGHIFILATEGVMRRDLSLRFKERLTHVGFVLLLMLMAFVIVNDLHKVL